MLCAPDELGISPSHGGILVLPDRLEPGADVASTYDLHDGVLDIEVTPNRPDFLSVAGIAREVSAATGVPLTLPWAGVDEAEERAEDVASLEIEDLERCPRYLARVVRDVADVPSPIAVQARLTASGMRPISAVVDATNFAMLEVGQPLHPFDLALLEGPGVVVRRAEEGERLVTLDDVERTFTSDDLLICDVKRPVAVAGVMGGELAEVSESTRDVLLESATFERGGVQRTRRRIALSTEASMRFERGVDPEAPPIGADRACALMAEWCGARTLRGVLEVGGAPPRRRIEMRASRASALIGYPVTREDSRKVFDRLGMAHEDATGDAIVVEIPGYRVDLEREVDLVEEVVRVQGYERVGSTLPPVRQPGGLPERYAFLGRVREALVRAGVREVRQVPFVSSDDLELTAEANAVRVTNPLAADEGWLRTSLLPGLMRAVRRNAHRQVRSIALFEAGTVFDLHAGAPRERERAAFALTGDADPRWTGTGRGFDTFDAKGIVEAVVSTLGVPLGFGEAAGAPYHPGRSVVVLAGDTPVGAVGELHPRVAAAFDVAGRVGVAELDLEPLMSAAGEVVTVRDVPRFPPVRRDLAFTVDASVPAGTVRDAIVASGGELLAACELFDVHVGPPLPEGKKSLAFSVDFRAPDRTLTDEETNRAVEAVVTALARQVRAELRTG
jgi:phenylalanyl-tRNA synthetase beta chain